LLRDDAAPAGLPDFLRRIRVRAGLTQTQVATALGVGARSGRKLISRLAHGRIKSPALRFVLDFRLCRDEFALKRLEELRQRRAAFEPILAAAGALLQSSGLSLTNIGSYRAFIALFLRAARETQAPSPERARRIERIIKNLSRPYHDPALIRRLADLVLSSSDATGRDESLPSA